MPGCIIRIRGGQTFLRMPPKEAFNVIPALCSQKKSQQLNIKRNGSKPQP